MAQKIKQGDALPQDAVVGKSIPSDASIGALPSQGSQDWRDSFIQSLNPEPNPDNSLVTGTKNFVKGAAQGTANMVLHPVDALRAAIPSPSGFPDVETINSIGTMAQNLKENPAHSAGQIVGPMLATWGASKVIPHIPSMLTSSGEGLQSAGANLFDRTVGTVKSDYSHGAQPGRGYLEGGGKPALTMRSLANKAEAINESTGTQLGDVYRSADESGKTISPTAVKKAVTEPLNRLENIQNSPGGVGSSPQLDVYRKNLMPPIDRAYARGGFKPSELFEQVKRPLSKNTRWNDPTMFDLNTVRQQGSGAVGGLLTDAVPESEPLNKIYQGSRTLAERATARADTGQMPLTQIGRKGVEAALGAGLGYATNNPFMAAVPFLADTVPAKTSAGYLLFQGGKALKTIGELANPEGRQAQALARTIAAQPKALPAGNAIDVQPTITPENRRLSPPRVSMRESLSRRR